MIRALVCVVVVAALNVATFAAEPATQPTPIVMPLWNNGVPHPSTRANLERDDGTGRIWNVSVPSMLVYLPPRQNSKPRMTIVFCPGGGYTHLTRLEGADRLVNELLPRNVVIVSLKYRLRPASDDVEADAADDAQQALRLLRQHASEWWIDSNRIGLAGASAGANLVLNVASRASNPATSQSVTSDSRPNFVVLLSPWPDGHQMGHYPIGHDAPPAFIASAKDDKTAPPSFAAAIDQAYKHVGVKSEFWLIDAGGHGAFTLGGTGEGAHWLDHLHPWLNSLGIE